MKTLLTFWFALLAFYPSQGQVTFSEEDKFLFQSKLQELKELDINSDNPSIVDIGKTFLGTPYVEKTLEVGKKETLVINLRGFDCTTYVENVLAFSELTQNNKDDFDSFTNSLKTIRYRNSFINGYSSRLHYFTEWIRNNNEKGILEDITTKLGGEMHQKPINFMGTHRDLYPFLTNDSNYQAMLEVEQKLGKESLCILHQDQIQSQEENIQDGDIIALATSIKGLDVTHTGFAIKVNGRLHLLHASSSGEVTITPEPLVDYLQKIKHNIGIIVARPL